MMQGALSVFRFELRRTLTPGRIAVWLMLILFPVLIVGIMKRYEGELELDWRPRAARQVSPARSPKRLERSRPRSRGLTATGMASARAETPPPAPPERLPTQVWGLVFFGLIPEVITLFGLLLWVPTLVHAELEGRTWIYLAVRPRGRVNVLLGKYLTAVTWTILAGWISTTLCVLVARPDSAFRLWGTMVVLVALASVSYGALYALFGVLLHRRAMVIAVAYTLIFEFLASLIPAVINKLTVQYRLRNLLFTGMDWWELLPKEAGEVFLGTEPAWLHVLVLGAGVAAVLWVASQIIQLKEYATVSDT
jgi:hypothetical protein